MPEFGVVCCFSSSSAPAVVVGSAGGADAAGRGGGSEPNAALEAALEVDASDDATDVECRERRGARKAGRQLDPKRESSPRVKVLRADMVVARGWVLWVGGLTAATQCLDFSSLVDRRASAGSCLPTLSGHVLPRPTRGSNMPRGRSDSRMHGDRSRRTWRPVRG